MNSKDFAIGVLSMTAMILLVGLVVIHSRPDPVRADGMTVVGGDYTMTVGALNGIDEEILYVLDGPEQKMIAYRFDSSRRQIEIIEGLDLKAIRESAESPQGATSQTKPGQRQRKP